MSPIISPSGGGGGGSQPSATVSVTTADVTFTGKRDFDLAGPASGLIVVTITAIAADGETFGTSGSGHPGFILEDVAGLGPGWSSDNVTYHPGEGFSTGGSMFMNAGNAPGYAVGQNLAGIFYTPRYLRVPLTIFDDGGVVVYSGVHHPTVTVRVDLRYSTP